MDCEQIRELLEAYALDALEPTERSAVERHLATCADCRHVVDEITDDLGALPMALAATSPLQPPSRLKVRLLRTVTETARQATTGEPAPMLGSARRRHPVTFRNQASGMPWRMIANIAAVLLLALSFTWGVRLAGALDQERQLRTEHAALIDEVIGEQEIVFEIIGFDDTSRQFLRAQQPGSTSYGKLFTRPGMPYVIVMAGRLPRASPGETFHLWVTRGGTTTRGGELTVDDNGFGLLVFTADQPGPTYDSAMVTLQPAGGTAPAGLEILR